MLQVAVGHSNDPDSEAAIDEVLDQIQRKLTDFLPTVGILFAAIDFDHALILKRVLAVFPEIQLIGGTTDGEISSVLGFEQDSLTFMVFCADGITITAGIGQNLSKDPIAACQAAVQQAIAPHSAPIQFCLGLPESLTTSGGLIVESLKQVLAEEVGEPVPIFGGLTADQWRSQQTYQFCQTEVYSDALVLLLFSGPIHFSHGIASGWQPIGKSGQVTRSDNNVVYEIDGQPALAFYQRYLGSLPPSSEYPLALFDAASDRHYMRAPSGIYDPAIGSVHFFGDVPTGAIVQITETTHDQILSASQQSTLQALENYPGQTPAAALFFSCASRRQRLGSRTREEYAQAQQCLSQALRLCPDITSEINSDITQNLTPTLPSCGFYTNGEIAPLQQRGMTYLHNETFITLLLGEATL